MTFKKKLILLLGLMLVSMAVSATSKYPFKRLTVINKSDMAIEISLSGKNLEYKYYLRIPEGSVDAPIIETFTVVQDQYSSSIYYVELWDPVYGAQCGTKGQSMDITRNVRVVVLPCTWTPPNGGEPPSIFKYGGHNRRCGR